MGGSTRGSQPRSIQPSRLWVDKGAFWETLKVTNQSNTLGNSAKLRIHQLMVRLPAVCC
jgi:hypothetical protein